MTVKIDYDSIPRSYREYLEQMVKEGEYLAIDDEVDWDLEMGAICRYADETMSPSPIFNNVKDSPGFRAAEWGFTKSGTRGRPWCRVAPNVGAPPDATLMEILEAYMHSVENNPVHPPKILDAKDAPCKENKWTGDDIDLMKLPVPLQHAGDAERMLQSAGVNTCQTPDGKWTSWSINRSAVHDKNTMKGYWIAPNQHNGMVWAQWAEKGEDIDPKDPLAVTYAFATRNHPEKGVWFFADSPKFGVGTEAYHTTEDYFGRIGVPGQKIKSGSGICIYSCLGTEEMVDQPKPHILTFRRAWPKDVQDKVMANWDDWGFRTPDPVLQKHASQSTPWVYFNESGEGETHKGDYESTLSLGGLGAADETEEGA